MTGHAQSHAAHPSHHAAAQTMASHARPRPRQLLCPFDLAESVATMAEADQCSEADALARILAAAGFASISALADAHGALICEALIRLPAACDASGARLVTGTRRFLGSPHWRQCVAAGWPVSDVFGVAEWTPTQRRDVLGLVPAIAFAPKPGRRLEAVTATGATFRNPDGGEIEFRRPSLHADLEDVVPWWQCPALINASEAA